MASSEKGFKGQMNHFDGLAVAGDIENSTATRDAESAADKFEVFRHTTTGVNFRTVGWLRAATVFLKVLFATGVLSIPLAMAALGAVPGALSIIGWGAFNTYNAIVQGKFRNNHAGCHTIADMSKVVGGVFLKELTGALYLIAWILATGSGIVGVSVALNTFSRHAICTVWWTLIATAIVIVIATIRKFHKLAWFTWFGFLSIFIAVLIVVVGVTTRDRPAAAPPTGEFEFGYFVIGHPTFVTGMSASLNIFVSTSGTSAFLPVIAEMKNPKDYSKAVYLCMTLVTASYLAFSLPVYRWCGQWVASPSLGSAGQTIKTASYAVGFLGLVVSASLFLHVSAKYVFVRCLRNSRHLQANTVIHWGIWVGCTVSLGIIAFIFAEAVPVFNYLLALLGSVCFGPLAMILPGWFWLYDHNHWRKAGCGKMIIYCLHWGIVLVGVFFTTGGTYAIVQQIIISNQAGGIGVTFSCQDNSNSS